MEKVILPKKLAEAIEVLRTRGIRNAKLLNYPSLKGSSDSSYKTICDYIYSGTNVDEDKLEVYMQAITIGYISDKSPEEKLRDYYEYHKERNLYVGISVIDKVLEIMELKIKGINS